MGELRDAAGFIFDRVSKLLSYSTSCQCHDGRNQSPWPMSGCCVILRARKGFKLHLTGQENRISEGIRAELG